MINLNSKKIRPEDFTNLTIQVDCTTTEEVIHEYLSAVEQCHIPVQKNTLDFPTRINFYSKQQTNGQQNSNAQTDSILNKYLNLGPQIQSFQPQLILTVIYMRDKRFALPSTIHTKTILLEEAVEEQLFSVDYETEKTLNKTQSISYLCKLTQRLLERRIYKKASFFDRKYEGIQGTKKQNTNIGILQNMLYQINGVGRSKAVAISQIYPSIDQYYSDPNRQKNIEKLQVKRGNKTMNLGHVISKKIQRILMSTSRQQPV